MELILVPSAVEFHLVFKNDWLRSYTHLERMVLGYGIFTFSIPKYWRTRVKKLYPFREDGIRVWYFQLFNS